MGDPKSCKDNFFQTCNVKSIAFRILWGPAPTPAPPAWPPLPTSASTPRPASAPPSTAAPPSPTAPPTQRPLRTAGLAPRPLPLPLLHLLPPSLLHRLLFMRHSANTCCCYLHVSLSPSDAGGAWSSTGLPRLLSRTATVATQLLTTSCPWLSHFIAHSKHTCGTRIDCHDDKAAWVGAT